MSNQTTVTVGDTEVQVTETDDGFEVTETNDFIQYVKSLDIASSNDVDLAEDVEISAFGDAVVSYESHISHSEIDTLIADSGVELGQVEASGDRVYIDLFDRR